MKRDGLFIMAYLVAMCLFFAMSAKGSDLDTNNIEVLIIQSEFEFGFPVTDTVLSITHIYRPGMKDWYVKFFQHEFASNKKPIVLQRFPLTELFKLQYDRR